MEAKLIRPDYDQSIIEPEWPSVFLAGPIKGAPEWNNWLICRLDDLNVNIFDPRRYDEAWFDYDQQVSWETRHLRGADVITFSFVNEMYEVEGRSYAQTSRFELGENLARAKANGRQRVVVFCEKGFAGASYFKKKVTEEYPDAARFFDDWDEYVECVREWAAEAGAKRERGKTAEAKPPSASYGMAGNRYVEGDGKPRWGTILA